MSSASDALRIAAAEVGYSRWSDPKPGTKYGRWYAELTGSAYYGESGVPYCAMFVSWVLHQAGVDFTYAYCPYILRDFKAARVAKSDARPGDVVLFDWGGDGVPDHVGLVELNRGTYYQTIEGNTSSGSAGSQSNGGRVARRTRSLSTVCAVIRIDYEGEDMTDEQARKLDAIYDEVTRTDDPTGRGYEMTTHPHVKWIAKKLEIIGDQLNELKAELAKLQGATEGE